MKRQTAINSIGVVAAEKGHCTAIGLRFYIEGKVDHGEWLQAVREGQAIGDSQYPSYLHWPAIQVAGGEI